MKHSKIKRVEKSQKQTAKVIEALGGVRELMAATGRSRVTVYRWMKEGVIPLKVRSKIRDAAKRKGVRISERVMGV